MKRGAAAMGKSSIKWLTAALFFLILLLWFPVLSVYANTIHDLEVWVTLHDDGSASVKESWDIRIDNRSNTEWYVAKHNLDRMAVRDLTVEEHLEDGTVILFDTLEDWDAGASREEKANKCGLVRANRGFEICWGFGKTGRHKYDVTYRITKLVKGYEDGSALYFNFLSDAADGVDRFVIHLKADEFALAYPQTRIWVYGYEADPEFTTAGEIVVSGAGRFEKNDYAVLLVTFEPGLLSPADQRTGTVEEVIEKSKKGSIWEEKDEGFLAIKAGDSKGMLRLKLVLAMLMPMIKHPVMWLFLLWVLFRFFTRRTRKSRDTKQTIKTAELDYCRELPFQGDLLAAYARLKDIKQVPESCLIGCYILKWLRTGQLEMIDGENSLRIHPDNPDLPMSGPEKNLFRMLKSAAGKDGILQRKEFKTWARENYSSVAGWISNCEKTGENALLAMGVYEDATVKAPLSFKPSKQRRLTEKGRQMTLAMFGFKRYLEDFTLLRERAAFEVSLWDEYLVFAQMFGIADKVAEQFKQLYPAYFAPPGTSRSDDDRDYRFRDISDIAYVSNDFSNSMTKGYRSGVWASSSSSSASSGGGGSSSSSGGDGASGGGGAGGR